MEIQTLNIQKNSKFLLNSIDHDNIYFESFYLDFENSKIYFQNLNFYGSIDLYFKYEEGEKVHDNFYVTADDFIHLCCYHDTLYLKDYCFSNSKNETIEIGHRKEEYAHEKAFFEKKENMKSFKLDVELLKHMKHSLYYVDSDSFSSYDAFFINNKKLYTTDCVRFYEANVSIQDNFVLPSFAVRLMSICDPDTEINYLVQDNNVYLNFNNELTIIYAKSNKYELMDTTTLEFTESYNHENFVNVKREDFINIIRFIESFLKGAKNARIFISIREDNLYIELNDSDFAKITKILPIETKNINEGSFILSFSNLKSIINHIDNDIITIQFKENAPTLNFYGDNKDFHIVCGRINE